jgi:hypothetical protein
MGSRGRYAFWFPLVLLGFLMLGGIVLANRANAWSSLMPADAGYQATGQLRGLGMSRENERGLTLVTSVYIRAPSSLPDEYWIAGVLVILLATLVWYAWGSGRVGEFVWTGICGLFGVVGFLMVTVVVETQPELVVTVGGSLVALGLCAAAWVYFGLGPAKRAVTAVGVLALLLGTSALLLDQTSLRSDQLLVAVGLLTLAWLERSLPLAAVALVFLTAGWIFLPGVAGLALGSAVLLAGGIGALVLRNRQPAQSG